MTPQDALLASSPPRSGHKPKKRETPRACPLSENPFFDARTRSVLEPAVAGVVWSHGAAHAQECRLRLKRTTPNAPRGCPPFKILDRPAKAGRSCAFASLRRAQTKTHVSVLERKIAPRSLF